MGQMTPDEVADAMTALAMCGAPDIVLNAAKVLFANGWNLDDFGNLCLVIFSKTQVFDKFEDAKKALVEDAVASKPVRTN